jgi:hypothetical protein
MFKVLNYGCSYPLIDEYIKYKICGPINATSFSIMAFILELTHWVFQNTKTIKYFIIFCHPKRPAP